MKIRNIKNSILRKHLRLDAINKRNSERMLRTGNGTPEQLEMCVYCIKIDKMLMRYETKLDKQYSLTK